MTRITALLLTAASLLAGCDEPANVANPISEPGEVEIDPRMLGAWSWVAMDGDDELGTAQLMITPGAPGTVNVTGLWTAMSEHDDVDKPAEVAFISMSWRAHPAAIGGEIFFSAEVLQPGFTFVVNEEEPRKVEYPPDLAPHPERGYWIGHAALNRPDRLTIRMLVDGGRLRALAKARDYATLEVDCGEKCSLTVFDLSADELAALAALPDEETPFSLNIGTFQRIDQTLEEVLEWE